MLRNTCPWLSLPTSTLPVSRQTEVFLLVSLYRFFFLITPRTQMTPLSVSLRDRGFHLQNFPECEKTHRNSEGHQGIVSQASASASIRRSSDVLVLPLLKKVKRAVREVLGPDRVLQLLVWGNLESPEPWWRIISSWLSWEVPPTMKTIPWLGS